MTRMFLIILLIISTDIPLYAMNTDTGTYNNDIKKTIAHMTILEKIGQLFIVPILDCDSDSEMTECQKTFMAQSPYKMDHIYVRKLIEKYHIGGVIFLGCNLQQKRVKQTITMLQNTNKTASAHKDSGYIPLIIMLDAEWGPNMRITDMPELPRAMTLGSLKVEHDWLIYEMGRMVAYQCSELGVHMNLAPVIDINSNPKNPIINTRSFGQDKQLVTNKALLYLTGMQDGGLLTCLKHFPGHGDTNQDSHLTLPKITHTKEHLINHELFPYIQLIATNKIDAIMTAHLEIPSLEPDLNRPSSLSHDVVTKLLKEELGFTGTVITDGLGMHGVTHNTGTHNTNTYNQSHAEIALEALKAGNHILLCAVDVPAAILRIEHAIHTHEISEEYLNTAVSKMLMLKEKAFKNTDSRTPDTTQNIRPDIRSNIKSSIKPDIKPSIKPSMSIKQLQESLYNNAIILLKNDHTTWPLKQCPNRGDHKKLDNYQQIQKTTIIYLYGLTKDGEIPTTLNWSEKPTKLDNSQEDSPLIQLKKAKDRGDLCMVIALGSPYGIDAYADADAILLCCENSTPARDAMRRALMGEIIPNGRLPVDTGVFKMGTGLN